MEEIRDRYVTYENIECYDNAVTVLDAMNELFELKPESKNAFWLRFENYIPEDYRGSYAKEGQSDILYHVCSNVFYIHDLFDEYEFSKGSDLLNQIEFECC